MPSSSYYNQIRLSQMSSALACSILIWFTSIVLLAGVAVLTPPFFREQITLWLVGCLCFFRAALNGRSSTAAALLGGIIVGGFGYSMRYPPLAPVGICAFSLLHGLGAMVVGGLAWRFPSDRRSRHAYLIVFLLPLLLAFLGFLMLSAIPRLPVLYDPVLYRFGEALGGELGIILQNISQRYQPLSQLLWLAYWILPAVSAFWFWERWRNGIHAANIGMVYAAIALLGGIAYVAVPACGPRYFFANGWPVSLQNAPLEPVPSLLQCPRNAMPSLHTAWALILLLLSGGRPALYRLKWLLFFLLTVTATLTTGEHYFIDLVVAIPFTLGIVFLLLGHPWFGAANAALTAIWLFLLRAGFVPSSPPLAWLLVAATLCFCAACLFAGRVPALRQSLAWGWPTEPSVVATLRTRPQILHKLALAAAMDFDQPHPRSSHSSET